MFLFFDFQAELFVDRFEESQFVDRGGCGIGDFGVVLKQTSRRPVELEFVGSFKSRALDFTRVSIALGVRLERGVQNSLDANCILQYSNCILR